MAVEIGQAGIAIGVPAAALVVGVVGGAWLRPGPKLRSAFQHAAAGIIFGAVATELVPVLVTTPHWMAVVAGFAIGVGLMLTMRALGGGDDTSGGSSLGMVAGLSVDLAVDGLLVVLALGAGEAGGLVLAGGISLETLFLGLALAATLHGRRRLLIVSASCLVVSLLLGGGIGALLLSRLAGGWQSGMLAFGAAALLYLVVEELLVEAHQGAGETTVGSALFFAGFGGTLAIFASMS